MNTPNPSIEQQRQEVIEKSVAAMQKKSTIVSRANSEPLPGALADAFGRTDPVVHGVRFRPLTAGDFTLMRMLNSPLYRQTQALSEHMQKITAGLIPKDAPVPKTDFEEVEGFECIYQFSIPVAQARAELAKGRDFFRERAMVEIADKHPPTHIPDLIQAVVANLQAGFATVIQHTAPSEDGSTTVNFQTPPAEPATASAGG